MYFIKDSLFLVLMSKKLTNMLIYSNIFFLEAYFIAIE